jgi:hypothetical protein
MHRKPLTFKTMDSEHKILFLVSRLPVLHFFFFSFLPERVIPYYSKDLPGIYSVVCVARARFFKWNNLESSLISLLTFDRKQQSWQPKKAISKNCSYFFNYKVLGDFMVLQPC